MTRFLVCPSDYYGIFYEINPWMSQSRNSIFDLAKQQWSSLYSLLRQIGVTLETLTPMDGLPDMVFTANAGLVSGNRFISSRFRHDVRQRESPYHEAWFRQQGYEIIVPPADISFEGEGDALWVGETLFLGYPIRTDRAAGPWLEKILNRTVQPLELVDPRFYHLDTCFCPLDTERVLYYPPALSAASQKVIETSIPHPIPINEEDALRFGANAIVIKKDVVLNAGCASLEKRLMDEGFTIHPTDLSEFIKSGGSAKCLILQL